MCWNKLFNGNSIQFIHSQFPYAACQPSRLMPWHNNTVIVNVSSFDLIEASILRHTLWQTKENCETQGAAPSQVEIKTPGMKAVRENTKRDSVSNYEDTGWGQHCKDWAKPKDGTAWPKEMETTTKWMQSHRDAGKKQKLVASQLKLWRWQPRTEQEKTQKAAQRV